jgi:hypothetical protein
MFFRFFQLREKGEWIPITDEANVSDVAQSRGAKRLTILACSEVAPHEAADKDAVQYKGPLYFDIDCKEDLDKAISSTKRLVSRLKDYGVQEDAIEVYCSGSKGMHVIVNQKTFSTGRGVRKLPAIYKEMAAVLFVEGMDFQVYSAKRGVCWRIPNVQRDDGKYRVRVAHSELTELDAVTYRELVKAPRTTVAFLPTEPAIAPKLQMLFEECKRRTNMKKRVEIIASDAQLERIKDIPPACIQEMVNWRGIESDKTFNAIALQVAAYIVRSGTDKETEASLLSMLAHRGRSSTYSTERSRLEHAEGVVQYVRHSEGVKFSCTPIRACLTNRPCEGCVIENEAGSAGDEVAESVIVARRDGYYTTSGKHDVKISNFTLEVDNVFMAQLPEGGRLIRQGATIAIFKNGEKLRSLPFSEEAWAGRSGLIKEVSGISNLSFTGGDADVQRIKQIVFAHEDEAETIMQVYTAGVHSEAVSGRHLFTYVEPGYSINSMKVTGTHVMSNKITSPPYLSSAELCPVGDEVTDSTLVSLFSMNSEENMAKIVGWFAATHLKEHFRLAYNQFPLLNVWGNAGSGKSRTLALVSWLNGTDYFSKDTSVNVTDITPWAALDFVSSTTTVPRLCEEFNKSKITQKTYTFLCELFKSSWNNETKLRGAIGGGKGQAGRTGAVTHSIPVSAPIAVASETAFSMPALLERSVQVFVSKNTRNNRAHFEKEVKTHRGCLRQTGKAMMFRALTLQVSDVERWMDEAEDFVPDCFETRPRYSLQVVRVGLMFMLQVVRDDLKLPSAAAKLEELISKFDADLASTAESDTSQSVRTEVDAVIETMGIMAARTSSNAVKGTSFAGLERGVHYTVAEGMLVIDYMLAHALYKQYAKSSEGVTAAIESTSQFLLLLQQESYYIKTEVVTSSFAGGRPAVWLSIPAMAEKGLTPQLFTAES